MNLPDSIVLLGKRWTIEVVAPDDPRLEGRDGLAGYCDVFTHEIVVRSNLHPEAFLDTVVHECFHAVLNYIRDSEREDEESDVMFATLGFHEIYRELGAWIAVKKGLTR